MVATDSSPYLFAFANNNLSEFQILYSNKDALKDFNPVESTFYELVISAHLNINKKGIILHSALVNINGSGYLFPGTSGAGKSTIARLWHHEKDAEVLADERILIRKKGGMLCAFNTPWQGEMGNNKNKGVPLEKIFFIKHGSTNTLKKLSVPDAANRLLVRCFPTFWHREGMQFAMDFCARIASEIECYEFSFVPDSSSVEFIKQNLS